MLENITEVIGFDLGHGETALSKLYLADSENKSDPELIEIFGKKNQITAIGYHPIKGICIGESALRTSGMSESHITFKKKPNGDPTYEKVMKDYIKKIYDTQIEQGRINENESFFIIGCPSAWTQDPTIVAAYEKLFLDAGLQQVKVVAESRAAYIHAVEKGMLNMAELKGSVVVIDLGSSTTDITLINQISNTTPIDVGRELGAATIDKAIFQRAMQKNPNRAEFEKIFNDHPHFQNRCELNCRQVKEAYFSDPANYQEAGEYADTPLDIQGRYFTARIDGPAMNEILNTPFVKSEGEFITWPAAFENEVIKLREQLELRQQLDSSISFSPRVILLTGGASRMNFVPEICKKIFPQAVVKLDDTPEFCIAKGLARWGRVEINTNQFFKDIEQFCLKNILPEVTSQIDPLYDRISVALADRVISIVKKNFDFWKNRTHINIDRMKAAINSEVEISMQEENLAELLGNEIRLTLDRIADEFRAEIKNLERKYDLPPGSLEKSFDLSKTDIQNFNLYTRPNITATDDIVSGLSSVIAWISGIVVAIISFQVLPYIFLIIVGIISLISTTIASVLFAFFFTNPLGWPVLIALGFAGGKTKAAVQAAVDENISSWDLPIWVRKLGGNNSVYSKIDEQRKVIVNEIASKLKGEEIIRQELTEKITSIFETSLKAEAENMRALIG